MGLRFAFYVLFSVFAAPVESWTFLLNGLGIGDPKLIWYPVTHGLLYVLSIILIAESIFRLVHHLDVTRKSFWMTALLLFAALLEIGISFFYIMAERIRILNKETLIDETGIIQAVLTLIAFIISWASFFMIEKRPIALEPAST